MGIRVLSSLSNVVVTSATALENTALLVNDIVLTGREYSNQLLEDAKQDTKESIHERELDALRLRAKIALQKQGAADKFTDEQINQAVTTFLEQHQAES